MNISEQARILYWALAGVFTACERYRICHAVYVRRFHVTMRRAVIQEATEYVFASSRLEAGQVARESTVNWHIIERGEMVIVWIEEAGE